LDPWATSELVGSSGLEPFAWAPFQGKGKDGFVVYIRWGCARQTLWLRGEEAAQESGSDLSGQERNIPKR